MRLSDKIKYLNPCGDAVAWLDQQPSWEVAWAACPRGDWMLWLADRLSGEPGSDARRKLVLAACKCARLASPRIPPGEDRLRVAIETAERWARGEEGVTLGDVHRDASAASAASADYADYARRTTLAQCADIVREFYPTSPIGD